MFKYYVLVFFMIAQNNRKKAKFQYIYYPYITKVKKEHVITYFVKQGYYAGEVHQCCEEEAGAA